MMFRRLFFSILALTLQLFLQPVAAQMVTAQQESQDSTINVIAYFCKNDTLGYDFQHVKMKIVDNDTTVNYYYNSEFQLIVRDSTSQGYKIEMKPISNHCEMPEDTLMAQVFEKIANSMGDVPLIFTTDEYGTIQHAENWREVRDFTRKSNKTMTDSLYALKPELAKAIDRQRLEASLNLQFANEKAILDGYEELRILFGLYGKSYRIGKSEEDVMNPSGYPQHLKFIVSYGKTSEDDGFEDDYFVNCLSEVTIPAKDVVNLTTDRMNMMYNHEMTDEERQNFEKEIDEDAKVSIIEGYDYFYNGWPCDMLYEKVTDLKNVRNVEVYRIQWTTRSWGIFGGGEALDTGVSL